jgi:hypothetical protein
MNTKPAFTETHASGGRGLAHAVAGVRTQMGHRGLRHRRLAAVGDALRSFRAADRLPRIDPLTGLRVAS